VAWQAESMVQRIPPLIRGFRFKPDSIVHDEALRRAPGISLTCTQTELLSTVSYPFISRPANSRGHANANA
jgi:hypothetical protein